MHRTSIGTWAYNIGPLRRAPGPVRRGRPASRRARFRRPRARRLQRLSRTPTRYRTRSSGRRSRRRCGGWGLGISGLAADLWSQHLIDTDDPGAVLAEFEKNAEFARDLGIGGVRVDTVQPPSIHGQIDYDTAFRRVVDTWKVCARKAAERGLYVTWEIEPGFAFNKPSDVQRILDAIPDDNFGVMYDTCHGQMVAVVGARQHGRRRRCRAASSSSSTSSRAGSTTST